MKNNRQIGLNGRVFISNCMKRGTVFVFLLMLGGIATAVADILKLTGASGAVMGSFSTTLLLYDFVCSLLLVMVVFYAYFLECGDGVPVLRHKPLLVFGCVRLGYLILLAYYVCYRALYCLCGMNNASPSLCIFYFVYFIFIFLCILANCFIYNILTRNIVRRSYIKSFHALSSVGLVVQVLLPVVYIIARVTMKDVGDEFFTTALCDLMRLCLCPICTTGIWLLYVNAIAQVSDVFNEVDTALREKRYQITYTSPDDVTGGKDKSSRKNAGFASAAFLPSPNKGSAALAGNTAARALPASVVSPAPSAAAPAETKPVLPTGNPSPVKKKLPPKPQPQNTAVQQSVPAADSTPVTAPEQTAQPVVYTPIVQEFNPYPDAVTPPTAGNNNAKTKTGKVQPVRGQASAPQKVHPVAHVQRTAGHNASAPGGNVQNNYRGKNSAAQGRSGNNPKRGGKG